MLYLLFYFIFLTFSGSHKSFIKDLSGHNIKLYFTQKAQKSGDAFLSRFRVLMRTVPRVGEPSHSRGPCPRVPLSWVSRLRVSAQPRIQASPSPHVSQFIDHHSYVPCPHVPDSRIQRHSPRPTFSNSAPFNFFFFFILALHYVFQNCS